MIPGPALFYTLLYHISAGKTTGCHTSSSLFEYVSFYSLSLFSHKEECQRTGARVGSYYRAGVGDDDLDVLS